MKKLTVLLVILSLLSCGSKTQTHRLKPDTAKVVAVYMNSMMKRMMVDTIFRIIKDSTKVDGERVTHYDDTMYYLPYYQPVMDSLRRPIKTKSGQDSILMFYYPSLPSSIPHLENQYR